MKIKVHLMIRDLGDGSCAVAAGPSQAFLRKKYSVDEDDFEKGWDVPVNWDMEVIETNDYEPVS